MAVRMADFRRFSARPQRENENGKLRRAEKSFSAGECAAARRLTYLEVTMSTNRENVGPEECPYCLVMKNALVRQAKAFSPRGVRDKLIDENEVAKYLDCSVQHVRAMRGKGSGPQFVVIGKRSVRYRPIDVRNYARRNLRKSTSDRDVRNGRS